MAKRRVSVAVVVVASLSNGHIAIFDACLLLLDYIHRRPPFYCTPSTAAAAADAYFSLQSSHRRRYEWNVS